MKLSISNIAWSAEEDAQVYALMRKYGYEGLEIAPTRIFPHDPYAHSEEAKKWAARVKDQYGFAISSMQSIWFGRQEKIFGLPEERAVLLNYTKKAIDFAEAIGCGNLVFGCPRNRHKPDGADESLAVKFFAELGDYAAAHNTTLALEANPPIYNTNYINDTKSAISLIKQVNSRGLRLNLDVGTMIENNEALDVIEHDADLINHVHMSEPRLVLLQERELHQKLLAMLSRRSYQGYVSIEMNKGSTINIEQSLAYVKEIADDI